MSDVAKEVTTRGYYLSGGRSHSGGTQFAPLLADCSGVLSMDIGDLGDVIETVEDLSDDVKRGMAGITRQPIGYWRGFICFVGVGLGIMTFAIPGLIGYSSWGKWVKCKIPRPSAALAIGWAYMFVILFFLLVYLWQAILALFGAHTDATLTSPFFWGMLVGTILVMWRGYLDARRYRTPVGGTTTTAATAPTAGDAAGPGSPVAPV